MKVSILSLFPDAVSGMLGASILGRAQDASLLTVEAVDLRAYATNKHRTVDDPPAGGGAGMVMQVDVVHRALVDVCSRSVGTRRCVLVDARGTPFTQNSAVRLARFDHLVVVCGRYEGVDARVEAYVDEVVSIGDYVLTGGELAALVIIDATVRLLAGVLGNAESAARESHGDDGTLEHRHYTRPVTYDGRSIPPVLLGGHHQQIAAARRKDALLLTAQRRPDLMVRARITKQDLKLMHDARVPTLDVDGTGPALTVRPATGAT